MPDPVSRLTAALADRYRLEVGSGHAPTLLGVGGMATVYLAQDIKHDRHGNEELTAKTGSR
jgi:hypothetical protein